MFIVPFEFYTKAKNTPRKEKDNKGNRKGMDSYERYYSISWQPMGS